MAPQHTARGIILHDDKLLLMERWRANLHYFSVPGGAIEPGETAEQTVVRELLEETGCQVDIDRLLYTLKFANNTEHSIFLCNYISGEPHLPADSPEALSADPHNRFRPDWVSIADLSKMDFLVWQPVKVQLLHDVVHGFADTPITLASEA